MSTDTYLDKIISRVNNLMAIAQDDGASDNEVCMAFERAQKLIQEHKLQAWQLAGKPEPDRVVEQAVSVDVGPAWRWLLHLASIVAEQNDCDTYYTVAKFGGRREHSDVVFVGVSEDIDAAAALYESIAEYATCGEKRAYHDQIEEVADELAKSEFYYGDSRATLRRYARGDVSRAAVRNGYWLGFLRRLQERFEALSTARTATGVGRELVALRNRAVQAHMAAKHLKAARSSRFHAVDGSALDAGARDGGNVGIGLREAAGRAHAAQLTA